MKTKSPIQENVSVSLELTFISLVILIVSGCSGGGGDDEGSVATPAGPVVTTDFVFEIDAKQVIQGVPAPAGASASANLRTSSGEEIVASGTVAVSGISATSVTINAGYAGEEGPAVVSLQSSGSGNWAVPANTTLELDEFYRLEATGYYISVDSPQGRMRGQILPADWGLVVVDLDGDSVVPPVVSTGSAKAGFAINPSTGFYHARITTTGIPNAISASVREAFAGARGDIVISLEQSSAAPSVWGTSDINNVNFEARLTSGGLDKYRQGKLHLSIETMTNLDGEIRGQLVPEGVSVFAMDLSDAEVVVTSGPPVVSAGSATAQVTYAPGADEFALALNTDLQAALSVFVHEATFGQNGPGIFSLTQDAMLPGSWMLPATSLSVDQEDALTNQGLYVSVVTSQFADGELRGQITLGDSVAVVQKSIDQNGGELTLSDPAGATFSLNVPVDAVFESKTLSMQRADLPVNLPDGIRSLGAIKLGPDGMAFGNAPIITMGGISGPSSGAARVGFLISDDGSSVEFTPLIGQDPVAASLPAEQHSFTVTHFSTVGIGEVDPAGPGIPTPSSTQTAEEIARQELADLDSSAANQQRLGVPIEPEVYTAAVREILDAWYEDIATRSASLESASAQDFSGFVDEINRARQAGQVRGLESANTPAPQPISANLFNKLNGELRSLDNRCLSGEPGTFDSMMQWLRAIDRLFQGDSSDNTMPYPMTCVVTVQISPMGPLAAIAGEADIEVTANVTAADGSEVSTVPALRFKWQDKLGNNQSNGAKILLDASRMGLRESEIDFAYFKVAGKTAAVIVPEHRGTRGLTATGSATCPDPDDNGGRSFGATVAITSQTVEPVSDTVAMIKIQGSGSVENVTITNLNVNATYDNNTDGRVDGSAVGSLSFRQTEVDEDTGETFEVSGSLSFGTGTSSGDLFSFPNVRGSDNFNCVLQGRVQVGALL